MIRMLVVVQTAISLGMGEQVFLTGASDELGRWNPSAVPMTRTEDNRGEVILSLRTGAPLEFKVTRGTWNSEEVDIQGRVPANRRLVPVDQGKMEIRVEGWKDGTAVQKMPKITGDYQILPKVHSKFLEHDRDVIVWFPPGYAARPTQRYPVLYMHDGTNVFRPGGIYGTWAAETNADSMISLGMMRETIIVATDTSTNRSREYIPPGDDEGAGPGLADQYAHLLIDYVKPMIESTYRALTNRADTIVMGSSYGGLVSLYLGLETNVFGKIGALSSAAVVASNFMGRVASNNTYGARIYLDMGTLDLDASLWESGWQMYNLLLQDGYAVNHDLCYAVGYGQTHNEAAWDQRLPGAYTFLLNILDEPNLLLQSANPPELELLGAAPGAIGVSIDTLKGRRYRLDRTDDLLNHPWTGVATSTVEQLLWSETTLTDTSHPSGSTYYYRVSAMSWPE